MNESEATGVSVRAALSARARRMSWEAEQRNAGLGLASAAPTHGRGSAGSPIKRSLRSLVKALYNLVKPVARPAAFRLRAYLLGPLLAQVQQSSQLAHARHQALAAELQSIRTALAQNAEQQRKGMESVGFQLLQEVESIRESVAKAALGTKTLAPLLERIEQYAYASARRVTAPGQPGEMLVRTAVGYLLCPDTDYALLAILLDAGDLEPGTRKLIQKLLRPGETFIDAGANIGMHTVAAARAMNGQGHIIAFEPHPGTHGLLCKSLLLNGFSEMAVAHQAAVSNRAGRHALFLGPTSGHHSLYALESGSARQAETIDVSLVRIDDMVDPKLPVDVIKIDVEGAELEALEGAIATIERNADVALIVEFGSSHLRRTGHAVARWLGAFERLGMRYVAIEPTSGELLDWTPEQVGAEQSVNLLLARPASKAWNRARGEA